MNLLLLLFSILATSYGYRLNVPRVLLPFHPTIPVKFVLEVSQPTGGCFYWRSTRPDVVSVTGVGVRPDDCSDRAEVRVTAKTFSGEMTAVIFADDDTSGTTLSCGVSVDQIASIKIETTTKVLFVDAAPVRMIVESFNKEGDHFSTLSEIPLNWELSYNGGDRPLRIVQFEQSTYDAPSEILSLEKQKKKGYVILLEGTGTGSATLTAKFTDQQLSKIPASKLDLTVVANLLLIPSYDLYVYPQTIIPFKVIIVKQHSQEVVPMPSSNYYLKIESDSICSLDKATSSVQALSRGKTSIVLLSQNVDVKAKTGIRPPSTLINVVDPDSLQWAVSGNNWILQKGKSYKLHVQLLDSNGNQMFIGNNLRFDSFLDENVFTIHEKSQNSTFFVVTPRISGKTTVRSRFTAVITKDDKELHISAKISGEQLIEVVDPIEIIPSQVVLPYIPREKTTSQLKAIGGTGSYEWSVDDMSICNIDKNQGLLVCSTLGTTRVTVTDRRNSDLKDTAEVFVINPVSVNFGETVKEAEIGTNLILNVEMKGSGPNGPLSFSDCRQVRWTVRSDDSSIFESTTFESVIPTKGTGCGTVELRAKSVGDATASIVYEKLQADVEVSAYEPLKASLNTAALAVGSSHPFKLSGGPRPWRLDQSEYFQEGKTGSSAEISFPGGNGAALIQCGAKNAQETIKIAVGNHKTSSLPLPMVSEIEIQICCALPSKLAIVFESNKCHVVPPVSLATATMPVTVVGYGKCEAKERKLDSISGLKVDWSLSHHQHALATLDGGKTNNYERTLTPKGKPGLVTVNAEVQSANKIGKLEKKLSTTADLILVEPISSKNNNLVLWNEKGSTAAVQLIGGSGQFSLKSPTSTIWTAKIADKTLTVSPKTTGNGVIRITDDCLPDSDLDINVKVTKIAALQITAVPYVEVSQTVDVLVEAIDETGSSYPYDLADTKLQISNKALQLLNKKSHHFVLSATEVGSASISATAKSSSGAVLSSRPHTIQVYSPISFEPKVVTLIPESTFQLEVIGGPLPTPPIEFSLNNSKIVDVQSNALITSRNLGYTRVTGAVSFAAGHTSTDSVIVRVVSLAGVALKASTQVVEQGGRLWITVQGKDDKEVPFSFGGAHHPFKITWSVDSPQVLRQVHPFGESVIETASNQYSIWLDGKTAGNSKVSVKVELSPNAKQHFMGSATIFEDSILVTVEPNPSLLHPEMTFSTLRLGPNAALPLEFNLPKTETGYSTRDGAIISVSPSGQLRSKSIEGVDTLAVKRNTAAGNETVLVPVVVSSPNSLDVVSTTNLITAKDGVIYHLPVGAVITLNVFARDFLGRKMHAVKSDIRFRPHRFDLTEISSHDSSNHVSISLRAPGETVLKIWDQNSLSTAAAFIRISAGEAIVPPGTRYSVSEVVCLKSPLQGQSEWISSDTGVQFMDSRLGVARFTKPGIMYFSVKTNEQTLHTKVQVDEVTSIAFDKAVHPFVTNHEGKTYSFPLRTSNFTDSKRCTAEQKILISELRPPIDCSISFTSNAAPNAINLLSVKPAYSTDTGSYVCTVSKLPTASGYTNLVDFPQTDLIITAKWNGFSRTVEDTTRTHFHIAMEVLETEIRLSNVQDPSILSVSVPKYMSKAVSVTGCEGDLLSINEISRPASSSQSANKFYALRMNVKSVALWNELSNRCQVKVENTLTGQVIKLPVVIKIVGNDLKQVFNALDSNGYMEFPLLFLQKIAWLIPSLMWATAFLICVIGGFIFMKKHLWESSGSFQDESIYTKGGRSPYSANSSSLRDSFGSSFNNSLHSSPGTSPRIGSNDSLWTTTPRRRL